MKGIVLAGGSGSRLHPLTRGISKQLMPIFDKPMIYYPISTLMMAGIRDILIITTPVDKDNFVRLLGDGSQLGCRFEYIVQDKPNGLAEAFLLGEDFIGGDKVALILGDNLFYGSEFGANLSEISDVEGGLIFAYKVSDPGRYGVVEFDSKMRVLSLEEKPKKPKSDFATVGLYFYDNRVIDIAKNLKPSARGELEITDVNAVYLRQGKLRVKAMDRGSAWLDTGTFDSMVDASDFIRVIQKRTGLIIGSVEEVAYRKEYIDKQQLRRLALPLKNSGYGNYLLDLIKEGDAT